MADGPMSTGMQVRAEIIGGDALYSCRVTDAHDRDIILAVRRGPVTPGAGMRVRLTWAGGPGPFTSQDAVVVRSAIEPATIWVRTEGEARVVQRREYVRMSVTLIGDLLLDGCVTRVGILDLSEGGARCVGYLPRPLAPGENAGLRFTVADDPIVADVEVVRLVIHDRRRLEVAVAFVGLSIGEADRIRAHVFAEQRRLLSSRRP